MIDTSKFEEGMLKGMLKLYYLSFLLSRLAINNICPRIATTPEIMPWIMVFMMTEWNKIVYAH